jgi:hypothetical protein
MRTIPAKLSSHHSKLRGQPLKAQQKSRCRRYSVAVKSRHFLARSTTNARYPALRVPRR